MKFKPDYGRALKAALLASRADEAVTADVEAAIARYAKLKGHGDQVEAIARTAISRSGLMAHLEAALVAEIVRAASSDAEASVPA